MSKMAITFDKDRLVQFLKDELEFESRKSAITGIGKIDWNPFDDDGDEYTTVWSEMSHNWDLIWDALIAVVGVLETIVVEGVSLSAPQKKDAAVSLLDDLLKLPFYLEPFDGIALGMLVDAAVRFMNKVNWGVDVPVLASIPSDVYKEIG
jgi:hypothetical protein